MTNPTFSPGDVVWHVRHGKVTLKSDCAGSGYLLGESRDPYRTEYYTHEGKTNSDDVGRVLFTLEEARQYGWLVEPLVVEFETEILQCAGSQSLGTIHNNRGELRLLIGKRVRVTVTEV